MLLFIRELACASISAKISIHLMLLFIQIQNPDQRNDIYFNTSHVTVYQYLYPLLLWILQISIHLMLLFIMSPSVPQRAVQLQFNTSHVTVYLNRF